MALVVIQTACHDLTGNPPLPAGYRDPTAYNTPSGARQLALGVAVSLQQAVNPSVYATALFTDELTELDSRLDRRAPGSSANESGDISPAYSGLQDARNNAQFARAAMYAYAPADTALIAGLYAEEGYAHLLLAELFCSGVPLSTVDFQRDFSYQAGSTSAQVYARAVALFDSASALASDTSAVMTLARVGAARTLLNLGQFDAAAQAASHVATTAAYRMRMKVSFGGDGETTEGNSEGLNGLPFASAQDPRVWPESTTTTVFNGGTYHSFTYYYPAQYADAAQGDSTTVVLASGVEARLIEAEVALHAHPESSQWLSILNALRTDGSFTTSTRTDVPGVSPGPAGYVDTTWGPGTGSWLIPASVVSDAGPQCSQADPNTGVTPACTDVTWYRGLAPLSDPAIGKTGQAATDARIDLLFRERAFWLYFTGHRQGDLRRLVRSPNAGGYGRRQNRVYPTGLYHLDLPYGTAVVFPIPSSERANPYFAGCLSPEA